MTKPLALAAAILFAAIPLAAAAAESDSTSIKNGAARAKQGVKDTARDVKQGVKKGAAQAKRGLAVAQCNDGRYSYTHHRTCNRHGGIRKRFR